MFKLERNRLLKSLRREILTWSTFINVYFAMGAREARNTFARVLIDAINASCSVSAWIYKQNNEVMRIIRKGREFSFWKMDWIWSTHSNGIHWHWFRSFHQMFQVCNDSDSHRQDLHNVLRIGKDLGRINTIRNKFFELQFWKKKHFLKRVDIYE